MKVHHLSCGTLCPFSRRFVNGRGSYFEPAEMICHCLLIEAGDHLVLVDSGLGLEDMRTPRERLGGLFTKVVRPRANEDDTALRQIELLGLSPRDVRHIVLTHLDLDHAGGLTDFPWATVHTTAAEKAAADAPMGMEKHRYRRAQWAHQPAWDAASPSGDPWFGFEAVRDLPGLPPEILMVPLYGHTRGHAAVAVRQGDGWMLHCGDAYFHEDEVDLEHPRCSPGLALFQRLTAVDDDARRRNQERLLELKREHGSKVALFCAHSVVEYDAMTHGPSWPSRERPAQAELSSALEHSAAAGGREDDLVKS